MRECEPRVEDVNMLSFDCFWPESVAGVKPSLSAAVSFIKQICRFLPIVREKEFHQVNMIILLFVEFDIPSCNRVCRLDFLAGFSVDIFDK